MALTLLTQPKRWVAAQAPVSYSFAFTLDLSPVQPFYSASTINLGGKLAIANTPTRLILGQRTYLAQSGSNSLLRQTAVEITDVVEIGETRYAVTSYPHSGIGAVDCYDQLTIASQQPMFALYIFDQLKEYVRYHIEPDNKIHLNLSSYLKKQFEKTIPPASGADVNMYKKYRLDFGIPNSLSQGETKYATNGVISPSNPECSNNEPNWVDVLPLQERCAGSGNALGGSVHVANTGDIEKLQIDTNPLSLTYNDTRWVYSRKNEGLCPVQVPAVVTAVTLFSASPNSLPVGGGNVQFNISVAVSLDVATTFTLSNGLTVTIQPGQVTGTSTPIFVGSSTQVSIIAISNPNVTNPNNMTAGVTVAQAQEVGQIEVWKAEFRVPDSGPQLVKAQVRRTNSSVPPGGTTAVSGTVSIYNASTDELVGSVSYSLSAGVEFASGMNTMGMVAGTNYYAKVTSVSNQSYTPSNVNANVWEVQEFTF